MRFYKQVLFPAGPDEVFAMLADVAFRERVAEQAGATSWDVSVLESEHVLHTVVQTRQPSQGLPGVVRSFVGSEFEIHQEEQWMSTSTGRLIVSIPGTPGSIHGTLSLVGDGPETVQTVESEIRVPVPLIGGKVEAVIGSALGRAMKVQRAVAADWLT